MNENFVFNPNKRGVFIPSKQYLNGENFRTVKGELGLLLPEKMANRIEREGIRHPGEIGKIVNGEGSITCFGYSEQHGKTLGYYDLCLEQQPLSLVESRGDVDLATNIGPFQNVLPFITAPMDSIMGTDGNFAREFVKVDDQSKPRGVACLPRANNYREHLNNIELAKESRENNYPWIFSIKMDDIAKEGSETLNSYNAARELVENGAKMILIDTAQGSQNRIGMLAKNIQDNLDVPVIVGSIGSYKAAKEFYTEYGLRYFRCGVGPGANCTTTTTTGVGYPQASLINEVSGLPGVTVIADGGLGTQVSKEYSVNSEGELVKRESYPIFKNIPIALALNGNPENSKVVLMMGGSIAGTLQSPKEFLDVDIYGNTIVYVDGQASDQYARRAEKFDVNGKTPLSEGVRRKILVHTRDTEEGYAGESIQDRLNRIVGACKSSFSYAGSSTLSKFYKNSRLVVTTDGFTENQAKPRV